MKIVINSDDLGISTEVNDCIFRQMSHETIRSATLMMNGPAVEDALRAMRQFPHCSFGVHLNLTQFAPLSAHPALAPLLNARGEFKGREAGHPYQIPLSKSICEGVFAEWCAQIDRALSSGLRISHIDSHHHTHTRWQLLDTLKALCLRYNIHRVRTRVNMGCSLPARLLSILWNRNLRSEASITTTRGFASFTNFHRRLAAGLSLPETMEVMCHPGNPRTKAENALLAGNWKALLPAEAELVSYDAMPLPLVRK